MDSYLDAAALAGRMVGISIYPRTAYVPNDSLIFKEISGGDKKMEYLLRMAQGPSTAYYREDIHRLRQGDMDLIVENR